MTNTAQDSYDLLNEEHADISYLMNDSISMVLSQALADTFDQQPNDPVEFFSKHLLHHIQVREQAKQNEIEDQKVAVCQEAYEVELKEEADREQVRLEAEAKVIDRKKKFFETVEQSMDLNENLQELADFVQENTSATGVYIGKLVYQKKAITDDAGENDDLDMEVPKVVQFTQADKSHKSLLNVVLTPEQAPITHSVFNFEPAADQAPPQTEEPAEGQDENAPQAVAQPVEEEDILDSFKHVYVSEVVREPRMWFKTVPRLGSFMSVPIIYDSCLSDESLDLAIADFQKVTAENEKLQRELLAHEQEQAAKLEAAVANGETYEKEEKVIEEVPLQPFQCVKKQFVICLDTMGQDCELTDEQRRFVLKTVQVFKEQWERAEVQCLTKDRDHRIELLNRDPQVEADLQDKVSEVINKTVEDLLAVEVPEDAPVPEEELKQMELQNLKLTTQAGMFKGPDGLLHEAFKEIGNLHVIKMPRIIQCLMFLMQIKRCDICEPDSNRLFWKHAKTHLNDLANRIAEYKMLGQKQGTYAGYETLNFCEKLINDYTQEEVDAYHPGFGKLFKWLSAAMALRKQDIVRRKALAKRDKEAREAKIDEKAQRALNRETYLLEALEKFNNDNYDAIELHHRYNQLVAMRDKGEEIDEAGQDILAQDPAPPLPVHNQAEFEEKFDAENAEVIIPDEVQPEIDNDWVLTEFEVDQLVATYFEKKGQTITI